MTVFEYAPSRDEILEFVTNSIRQLRDADTEPAYIVVGPEAYVHLRKAIGEQFQRGAGQFATYQTIPIVVDPFRADTACVLPGPATCATEVRPYRMDK